MGSVIPVCAAAIGPSGFGVVDEHRHGGPTGLAAGARSPRYRQLADENRIRLVPRSPTRGRLLDRKGRVLASSKLTYSLYVEPRLVDDAHGRNCAIGSPDF